MREGGRGMGDCDGRGNWGRLHRGILISRMISRKSSRRLDILDYNWWSCEVLFGIEVCS